MVKEWKEIIVDADISFFASQLEQKIRSLKGFIYLTSPFSSTALFLQSLLKSDSLYLLTKFKVEKNIKCVLQNI